ncbi:MAG: hypothetical protein PVH77_11870, partial [Phycisphaerales bacterium]
MSEKERVEKKKWLYGVLSLLMAVGLFGIIFAINKVAEPPAVVASENKEKEADTNETPAEPNEQEVQDPNDKEPKRPEHKHPAFKELVEERKQMVARQIQARDVKDPNVLKAMQIVPRHAFVRPSEERYA